MFSETFKDHYTSFANIKNSDAVHIFHVLGIDFSKKFCYFHVEIILEHHFGS